MKAVLTCLLLLMTGSACFSIGRPHNLFVARKALIERRTAATAPAPAGMRPLLRSARMRAYSYTFSPCFSQMLQARE